MARGTDTGGRIKRLEHALEQARKLPKKTVLESNPMRELMGYSWVQLRNWCNDYPHIEASGAFIRGGNGVAWQFKPVATIEALLAQFRSEVDQNNRRNRRLQSAVGVSLPEEESTASLDETAKLVRLTLEVQKTKLDQGQYTPTASVAEFLDSYNRVVVEGILGAETEADPTGRLDPAVREAMNEALRNLAVRVHAKAEAYIGEYRARAEQAGVAATG